VLAGLAGANTTEAMFCARHKSTKSAKKYFDGVAANVELIKRNSLDYKSTVPPWVAFRITDMGFAAAVNAPSEPFQKPLPELARQFCEDVLRFPKVSPCCMLIVKHCATFTIKNLHDRALQYKRVKKININSI
jgi:hypothetical protein